MNRNLAPRIMVALLGGLLTGILCQLIASSDSLLYQLLIHGASTAIGDMFVAMIKLMVVPLVFISIVNAVCDLDDINQFGRLGGKTFIAYIINTLLAIAVAMVACLIISPGENAGFTLSSEAQTTVTTQMPSVLQLIVNIVPENPFQALAEGNILQILFMALLTGVAIKKLENQDTHSASKTFRVANKLMMKLTLMVMSLAPIGVFFLVLKLAAIIDYQGMISMLSYITTALGVMVLWLFFVYPVVVGLLTNSNPLMFIRKTREQMMFAVSTASSNATIPVTYRTLTEKMGVSEKIAGFSVPLGATMNMSGSAIYITVGTLFVANAYGFTFDNAQLATLAFTAFLLAVATGGVPGGAMVMTGVLIHQMGLPAETFGVIVATDRILDAGCTVTSVVGDTAVSTIIARSEGELDEKTLHFEEVLPPV
ncbi:dicarboxylate/amino acid:cation symporter [Spongorhabdus nitratireducens]